MNLRRSIRVVHFFMEGITLAIAVLFIIVLFIVIRGEFRSRYFTRQAAEIDKVDIFIGAFIQENLTSFTSYLTMPDQASGAVLMTNFSEIFDCSRDFTVRRVLRREPESLIFPGYDLSTSSVGAFLKTVADTMPRPSPLSRSPQNDRLGVYIAARTGDGFLVGRIDLDIFRKNLTEIAGYTDSVIILASKDGFILSSTDDDSTQHLIPERGTKEMEHKGILHLYTRKRSVALDNDIAMLTPESAVFSFLTTLERYFALFIALMVALITMKILWQHRRILRPLGHFSTELARWEADSPWPDLPPDFLAYHEIGSLFDSFRDKTRRIAEALAALRRNEELFRQLADNVRETFWLSDISTGRVEYINQAVEQIWGRRREHFTVFPTSFLEAVPSDDTAHFTELGAAATGTPQEKQFRITQPDGSVRWISARTYPVMDAAGTVYRIAGIAEDITRQRWAENNLRVQRDLGIALSSITDLQQALNTILESALAIEGMDAGGIYLVEHGSGTITLACARGLTAEFNASVEQFAGNSPSARLVANGTPLYVESADDSMELLQKASQGMAIHEGITSIAIIPITHANQSIACMNIASRSHSTIPATTRDALEAIAAVIGSTIVRIESQEQIAVSLHEKEVLLREIHHRVKNNMQIIVSLLDLQSRSITNEELLRTFDDSRNRIRAMALIHERLYQTGNFSRIEFSSYSNAIATQLMATYRSDRRVSLSLETEQIELSLTQAIPCGLILNELVTNALKYAFPASHEGPAVITIGLRRAADDRITLSVADNGVGFPPEQGDAARRDAPLGMTLVTMLSRQIGGSLDITRQKGTLVTVTFTAQFDAGVGEYSRQPTDAD